MDYKGDEEGLKWTIESVVEGGTYYDIRESAYNDVGARLAQWIYSNKAWETVEGDMVIFTLDEVKQFERAY